jgi:hypothetical protein
VIPHREVLMVNVFFCTGRLTSLEKPTFAGFRITTIMAKCQVIFIFFLFTNHLHSDCHFASLVFSAALVPPTLKFVRSSYKQKRYFGRPFHLNLKGKRQSSIWKTLSLVTARYDKLRIYFTKY